MTNIHGDWTATCDPPPLWTSFAANTSDDSRTSETRRWFKTKLVIPPGKPTAHMVLNLSFALDNRVGGGADQCGEKISTRLELPGGSDSANWFGVRLTHEQVLRKGTNTLEFNVLDYRLAAANPTGLTLH